MANTTRTKNAEVEATAENEAVKAVTVRKREDLARIIKNAFYIARTGKPGPVVVDIPKDIQLAMGSDEYPTEVTTGIPVFSASSCISFLACAILTPPPQRNTGFFAFLSSARARLICPKLPQNLPSQPSLLYRNR